MLPVFEIFNVGTKEQCYPFDIPIRVCSVFMCPNNGVCCQCWRFLMWAQMLMHVTAHGGCMDTVRESALKVDSGRKIPCHTCQYFGLDN